MDLRLLPGLAERGQVLAGVAVEEELVRDRLEHLVRPHLLGREILRRQRRLQSPVGVDRVEQFPRAPSPSCAMAWRDPLSARSGFGVRTVPSTGPRATARANPGVTVLAPARPGARRRDGARPGRRGQLARSCRCALTGAHGADAAARRVGRRQSGRVTVSVRSASFDRSWRSALVWIWHTLLSVTPEHLADLRQRQAVVVVHHQDGPLPFGHAVDRLNQCLLGLLGLERVDRAPRPVGQRLTQRRALGTVAAAQHLVERHHADRGDLAQRLVEVTDAHLELGRDLGLVRRAPQRRLEVRERLLDRTGLGAHRPRYPVDRPQLVDDRPLDARNGVRLEPQIAVRLESLDRVDEPDDAVTDEVLLVEVPRQSGQHPAGDVLDERRVVDDQLVAQRLRSGLLELGPEAFDAPLD